MNLDAPARISSARVGAFLAGLLALSGCYASHEVPEVPALGAPLSSCRLERAWRLDMPGPGFLRAFPSADGWRLTGDEGGTTYAFDLSAAGQITRSQLRSPTSYAVSDGGGELSAGPGEAPRSSSRRRAPLVGRHGDAGALLWELELEFEDFATVLALAAAGDGGYAVVRVGEGVTSLAVVHFDSTGVQWMQRFDGPNVGRGDFRAFLDGERLIVASVFRRRSTAWAFEADGEVAWHYENEGPSVVGVSNPMAVTVTPGRLLFVGSQGLGATLVDTANGRVLSTGMRREDPQVTSLVLRVNEGYLLAGAKAEPERWQPTVWLLNDDLEVVWSVTEPEMILHFEQAVSYEGGYLLWSRVQRTGDDEDTWLFLALDREGNELWRWQEPCPNIDLPSDLVVSPAGEVLAAGYGVVRDRWSERTGIALAFRAVCD